MPYLHVHTNVAVENHADVSQQVSTLIRQQLETDIARIYIEFTAPERAMFGWNGGTF